MCLADNIPTVLFDLINPDSATAIKSLDAFFTRINNIQNIPTDYSNNPPYHIHEGSIGGTDTTDKSGTVKIAEGEQMREVNFYRFALKERPRVKVWNTDETTFGPAVLALFTSADDMETSLQILIHALEQLRNFLRACRVISETAGEETHVQALHQVYLKWVFTQVFSLRNFEVVAANRDPALSMEIRGVNGSISTLSGHADLLVSKSENPAKTFSLISHHIEMKNCFNDLPNKALQPTKQLIAENMGFRARILDAAPEKRAPMKSYLCDIMSIRMCLSTFPDRHYVETSIIDPRQYVLRILYAMRPISIDEANSATAQSTVEMVFSRDYVPPLPAPSDKTRPNTPKSPPGRGKRGSGGRGGGGRGGGGRGKGEGKVAKRDSTVLLSFDDNNNKDERICRMLMDISDAINGYGGLRNGYLKRELGVRQKIDGSMPRRFEEEGDSGYESV